MMNLWSFYWAAVASFLVIAAVVTGSPWAWLMVAGFGLALVVAWVWAFAPNGTNSGRPEAAPRYPAK